VLTIAVASFLNINLFNQDPNLITFIGMDVIPGANYPFAGSRATR
jgi:hypothetical protein